MCGLELHGTGTSLGDPIEIGAAFEVLGSSRIGAPSIRFHHKTSPGYNAVPS